MVSRTGQKGRIQYIAVFCREPLQADLPLDPIWPRFEPEERKRLPGQKPAQLLDWLVRAFCPAGGTLLDFVSGLGTSAVAAGRAGRKFICIGRDIKAFAMGRKRVRDEFSEGARAAAD